MMQIFGLKEVKEKSIYKGNLKVIRNKIRIIFQERISST